MALDLNAPIAELELYGLSVREIGAVEEGLGAIYLRDLRRWTAEEAAGKLGSGTLRSLIAALKRLDAGQPVMTAEECAYGE